MINATGREVKSVNLKHTIDRTYRAGTGDDIGVIKVPRSWLIAVVLAGRDREYIVIVHIYYIRVISTLDSDTLHLLGLPSRSVLPSIISSVQTGIGYG